MIINLNCWNHSVKISIDFSKHIHFRSLHYHSCITTSWINIGGIILQHFILDIVVMHGTQLPQSTKFPNSIFGQPYFTTMAYTVGLQSLRHPQSLRHLAIPPVLICFPSFFLCILIWIYNWGRFGFSQIFLCTLLPHISELWDFKSFQAQFTGITYASGWQEWENSSFNVSLWIFSTHSVKRMKRNGGEMTAEYFIPFQLPHQTQPSRGSVHPTSFLRVIIFGWVSLHAHLSKVYGKYMKL